MAKMQAQIPFPSEFYNTIMILVTIFTVLWGIKAVKRLYYMLRVRSAALTDRIIHIRGLGSYLTYFEGAYQPHLNAIVHTRQTKPAVDTNVVFVPFSVQQAQLKRSFQQNYEVQVNVSTPINSKMVLFYNFKSNSFKNMVSRFRKANPNNVYEDSNSQRIFLENLFQLGGLGGNINGNSKQEIRPSMPANLSGTSEFECIVKDLPKGTHQVSFNLTESMTIALDSRLNAILARPPAPVPVSEPATPAPTAALVADGVGDGLVGPEGPSGNPSSTTSSTRVVEEDAIQIGILIIPSSSFDASRNPLYKPNKKVTSASASVLQHGSTGNSRSVVPEGQRDSDGPLMEYEMTTSSMHEGLMMTNMASGSGSSGDEENHTQHANGASSSSGSAAVSAAGAVPHVGGSSSSPLPRQAVSCSALYSFAVPLGPLLTASCGPGWTHLRATPSAAQGRVGGAVVAAAAAILPAPLCVSVSVNEMWLFDLSNQLYASQEIFGLGPSAVPPPAAATNTTTAAEVRPAENLLDLGSTKDQLSSSSSSSSSSSGNASAAAPSAASVAAAAVASGGKYVAEDCVVCLTDPKEIALLPCRHLCVCVGCLIYIDKCPVCRAAFEEYVVIQSTKEMPVSVPSLTEPIKL